MSWTHRLAPSVAARGESTHRLEESTADGIYGIIISAAVMAASHERTTGAVARAVLLTLLVYWVAERYALLVAARIHDGRRLTWREVRSELGSGWAMVTASTLPLVVLALTGLFSRQVSLAVLLALSCSTLLLCLAGWEVGRGGRLSVPERVVSAAVAGLFGASMIALKALLH